MMINATGRRKTSVARVYITSGNGKITINKRTLQEYFPVVLHQNAVQQPLAVTGNLDKFDVTVNVTGGGITGQADAVKLGIARALVKQNEELRSALRGDHLRTRDSMAVERKKSGQKKASKRFQFSKR